MSADGETLVKIIGPLGTRLDDYKRSQPPALQQTDSNGNLKDDDLQTFIDAMKVREEVFVHEQKVSLENEFDEDDRHCVHIVLYTSSHSLKPIGTIRIVPATSTMHQHLDKHRTIDGQSYEGPLRSSMHDGIEPFIRLGRLAVISGQRGCGYAGVLVLAALNHAASHPDQVAFHSQQSHSSSTEKSEEWRGLVLIHAQQQVQKFWAKSGFELDESIGIWDEEGMDHVAMWKRLSVGV